MIAVDRIVELGDLEPEIGVTQLPSAASASTSGITRDIQLPRPDWPEKGAIEFFNASMRYRQHAPEVLRNLNISIDAREKVGNGKHLFIVRVCHVSISSQIGIVGRTGAGKSSLLSLLFRMSAHITGLILIDGVDTSTVELGSLRSRISVIPQDPTLFSGSMRYNLDPFDEYTDAQLWGVLDKVQLSSTVKGLPGGLTFMVSESGSNFSVGQRQLLCMARAMLRYALLSLASQQ